jgi:hypothetical protein
VRVANPPVAGLAERIDLAESRRIDATDLPRTIACHRLGCDACAYLLLAGHEHVIYRIAAGGQAWPAETLLGLLFVELHHAVDTLRVAEEPLHPDYFARALRQHVPPAYYAHYLGLIREDASVIRAPRSTNSARKKRGLPPYPDLHRTGPSIDAPVPFVSYREETDMLIDDCPTPLIDLPTILARATPLAKDVAGMISSGYSKAEIAESLRISRRRIKAALESLHIVPPPRWAALETSKRLARAKRLAQSSAV